MNIRAALKPTFNNATIKANCNTDVIKAKIGANEAASKMPSANIDDFSQNRGR